MSDLLLKAFDKEANAALPSVQVGDSVTVYVRINVGDKNERVQMVLSLIHISRREEKSQKPSFQEKTRFPRQEDR